MLTSTDTLPFATNESTTNGRKSSTNGHTLDATTIGHASALNATSTETPIASEGHMLGQQIDAKKDGHALESTTVSGAAKPRTTSRQRLRVAKTVATVAKPVVAAPTKVLLHEHDKAVNLQLAMERLAAAMEAEHALRREELKAKAKAAAAPMPALTNAPTAVPANAQPTVVPYKAPFDRDRVLNDVLNTGVMAALVGGFALTNLEDGVNMEVPWEGYIVYVCSYTATHACTCSALTSALLYREVNLIHDDRVEEWATSNRILLLMPMIKFGMGVACYLFSVILLAWVDLAGERVAQIFALVIGVMSMSMVLMTVCAVAKYNVTMMSKSATAALERASGIDLNGDGGVGAATSPRPPAGA